MSGSEARRPVVAEDDNGVEFAIRPWYQGSASRILMATPSG